MTCKDKGDQPADAPATTAPERETSQDDLRGVGLNQRHWIHLCFINTDHQYLLRLLDRICRWCRWFCWWHWLIVGIIGRGIPVAAVFYILHSLQLRVWSVTRHLNQVYYHFVVCSAANLARARLVPYSTTRTPAGTCCTTPPTDELTTILQFVVQQIHHQRTNIFYVIPTSWHTYVEMLGSGIAMWQIMICCTSGDWHLVWHSKAIFFFKLLIVVNRYQVALNLLNHSLRQKLTVKF